MIEITAKLVSALRAATGAPLMKCKSALVEAGGDLDQASRVLRQKEQGKDAGVSPVGNQGYIAVYSHPGNQIVSIVELACDTDFVARSDAFRRVAGELAMQVAATAPVAVAPSDISETVRDAEFGSIIAQLDADPNMQGKSADLRQQIAHDKARKKLSEQCLLTQDSIRDPNTTVGTLLDDLRLQVREGVYVRRFARWQVGTQ